MEYNFPVFLKEPILRKSFTISAGESGFLLMLQLLRSY